MATASEIREVLAEPLRIAASLRELAGKVRRYAVTFDSFAADLEEGRINEANCGDRIDEMEGLQDQIMSLEDDRARQAREAAQISLIIYAQKGAPMTTRADDIVLVQADDWEGGSMSEAS